MSTATAYRIYPASIKDEIAETRNVYLFPELKIPRTTAQYWVKKRKPVKPASVIEIEAVYKRKSEHLLQELEKERALRQLIETARRVFPYNFQNKRTKSKYVKNEVVSAVRLCNRHHKLARCLQAIGLTRATYRRWASEIFFCNKTQSPCARRSASELTREEVETMKKFVTSRKYAHISVSSLHLLTQRLGELFCSIDTWYKYIHRYEWKRPWYEKKKKIQKTGIRAQRVNEIWHVDVTVVNIRPGYKPRQTQQRPPRRIASHLRRSEGER